MQQMTEMPAAAADYAVKRGFGNLSETEQADSGLAPDLGENSLPENFPMRHVFEKLGFKSVEEVQAKPREELTALDGIGAATADKALAFGKN